MIYDNTNKGPADAAADRAAPERHADDLRDVPGHAHNVIYYTLLLYHI